MSRAHWLIYALGSGWGHLTRSFAIARAALKQDIDITIFANSEYLPVVKESQLFESVESTATKDGLATIRIKQLDASADRSDPRLAHDAVRALLTDTNYSHVVVDTFPRGLVGDLVGLLDESAAIAVLVARDLNPAYISSFGVEDFVNRHYRLVLNPGEPALAFRTQVSLVSTSPWTVLDADELPAGRAMRLRLGIEDTENPVVIVCASGTLAENRFYFELTRKLTQMLPHVCFKVLAASCPEEFDQSLWIRHYPGIEALVAADIVIGAAGYNTVTECTALNVPLIAFAQERLYDRQRRRAALRKLASPSSIALVQDENEAFSALIQIENLLPKDRTAPEYANGAHDAVSAILRLPRS